MCVCVYILYIYIYIITKLRCDMTIATAPKTPQDITDIRPGPVKWQLSARSSRRRASSGRRSSHPPWTWRLPDDMG